MPIVRGTRGPARFERQLRQADAYVRWSFVPVAVLAAALAAAVAMWSMSR